MCVVFQESQAVPLVAVHSVIGEANPNRGLHRQHSRSEEAGPERGGSQRQTQSEESGHEKGPSDTGQLLWDGHLTGQSQHHNIE